MLVVRDRGRVLILCPQLAGHAAFGTVWRELREAGGATVPFERKKVRPTAL